MASASPHQTHHLRDGAGYFARESAPMLVVLGVAAALVAGLALVSTPADPQAARTVVQPAVPSAGPYDGFRFEMIGAGVMRLRDDGAGHRPGERLYLLSPDSDTIAFEADGSVLICCDGPDLLFGDSVNSVLYRLGDSEPVIRWDDDDLRVDEAEGMVVDGDGRIWLAGTRLTSLGPDGWRKHGHLNDSGILVTSADGSVWADASDWRGLVLVRARPQGRSAITTQEDLPPRVRRWDAEVTGLATTPDGHVWAGVSATKAGGGGGLLRFDGTRWRVARSPGGVEARVEALASASDGTLWAYLSRDDPAGPGGRTTSSHLASFDGKRWSVYGEAESVPHHGWAYRVTSSHILMSAGPDGTVWLTPVARGGCRQLVAWRSGTATSPLPEAACVEELEVAPDGSAWVMVDWDPGHGAERRFTELLVVDA